MDEDRTRADAERPTADAARADDAGPTSDETAPDAGASDATLVDLDGTGVVGDRPPRPPIEPESVDLEHAAFVVAGALLTVAVIAGFV